MKIFSKKKKVLLASLASLLLGMTACGPTTFHVKASAPTETIKQKAGNSKPVKWKIPLGTSLVEDMEFLGPEKLLVGLRNFTDDLSNGDYLLVNTESGNVIWRYDRKSRPGEFGNILTLEDLILFRVDDEDKTTLLALDTQNGTEKWTVSFKSSSVQFLPLLEGGQILSVEQTKDQAILATYDLSKGTIVWKKNYPLKDEKNVPPTPIVTLNTLWHFYDGIEKLDGTNGSSLWKRSDVRLGGKSPLSQQADDKLYVIDSFNHLQQIDANSGKTDWSTLLIPNIDYTNIFPLNEKVFVRGSVTGSTESTPGKNHWLLAMEATQGKMLWKYPSEKPTVSNLIEDQNRLYFASSQRIYCLDSNNGGRVFIKKVTSLKHPFPVRIKKHEDSVAFVGELNIGGFDPKSGRKKYNYGFTPISESTHLSGLDTSIARLKKELKQSNSSSGAGSSALFMASARNSQNMANHYNRQASLFRSSASSKISRSMSASSRSSRNQLRSSASFDRMRAAGAANQASINNSFSKAYSSMGMMMSAIELRQALEQAFWAKQQRNALKFQQFFRNQIITLYSKAEEGDYVFRPGRTSDLDFSGVRVIHLPTGKYRETTLSPSYEEYGLWNLIDYEKGIVYHHGLGLNPANYQYIETSGAVKRYQSFLIAQPVKVPK